MQASRGRDTADLSKRRLRRGSFPSLDHLVQAIIEYLDHRNRDPKPFVWPTSADSILAKLRGCMPITETIHQNAERWTLGLAL